MIGAFESEAKAIFHANVEKALSVAIQEAIITNGIVHEITSIKVSSDHINFSGKAHRNLFLSRVGSLINSETPYLVTVINYDINFHTIWHNIINKVVPLGFLVLRFPVKVISEGLLVDHAHEFEEDIIINIQLDRTGKSLGQTVYGETLCNNCGKAINPKRLEAVPGTLYCIKCMNYYEKGDHSYDKRH